MPGVLAALGPEAVAENVLGVLPANFDEFAVVPLAFYDAGVGVVEGRATGCRRRVGVDRARQQAVRDVNDHDSGVRRDALGG